MADRIMTPEIRQALLSKVPFSPTATLEYTPKTFFVKVKDAEGKDTEEFVIPEEFRPVFILRTFKKGELPTVKDVCMKGNMVSMREWTRKVTLGWRNHYWGGSDEELVYAAAPEGGADKEMFDEIPEHVMVDILMYVSAASGLLDKDRMGLTV